MAVVVPSLDDLVHLEAELAGILQHIQSIRVPAELGQNSDKMKEILRAHASACRALRSEALTMTGPEALLEEIRASSERVVALQTSVHKQIASLQRAHLTFGASSEDKPRSGQVTPADSYAADISTRLVDLNERIRGAVEQSSGNVQSMERSVKSVKALSTRYKDFGTVSQESRRLVSRHAAKKRRDLHKMKGAIVFFAIVCLYIVVRRMPILTWIVRLTWKFMGGLRQHRPGFGGGGEDL